ncbi:MAG: flagellar basal body rod protein FlgC [Phycisphaerae bacterium]|jgi:flagellar basal-body rod protein FlgC|nr:flagellar basal body rod protein FlgC [Phycisphaerae bacterium]HOO16006.1 flagellar basal body rod protein FlgC [Phycisphaerae bacterium]HPC21681.1 flagellar basal body rod protein FlgC [Phycisphaerae bacterium]HRS26975.1 flagellar basal body rod protein FlgC [Phycisphaerae bacterium]HRT42480.1 flagellar basal body rod protein FlgC [Phycisphaerae bacterium]
MIGTLDITRSALIAERTRLDVIAGNIANANVTRQADGTILPYRRRFATFMSGDGRGGPGVHVDSIEQDPSDFKLRYAPGSPDAIPSGPLAGYVQLPNVNITMEYVDALEASRAYEANVAMLNVTKSMLQQAIRLFA